MERTSYYGRQAKSLSRGSYAILYLSNVFRKIVAKLDPTAVISSEEGVDGWLRRWRVRHHIKQVKMYGEADFTDCADFTDWLDDFQKIFSPCIKPKIFSMMTKPLSFIE